MCVCVFRHRIFNHEYIPPTKYRLWCWTGGHHFSQSLRLDPRRTCLAYPGVYWTEIQTRSVTIAWPHSQSLAAKMSGLNLQWPSLGHQGCNVLRSGKPHPGWGGSRLVTKKCSKLLCPFVKLGCYCCPRVPLQIRASFLLKDYGRWSWQMQQAWRLIQN